jgi:hypothetical protein
LDTHQVLAYFSETFGFDAEDTVILLGAHTVGRVHRENSGFDGTGWDENSALFDNA